MSSFGGPWTLEKLGILYRYLDTYTTVLKDQPFRLTYVDAFAGDGTWRPGSGYASDDYGEFKAILKGSAARALEVQDKSFDQLVFIEKDKGRSNELRHLARQHSDRDIKIITEDANLELPKFCRRMGKLDRAVVFLDPYATAVDWNTVEAIANTKKIDCWILFPLMAIARMMPTGHEPPLSLKSELDRIFGGRVHWQEVYHPSPQLSMFDSNRSLERASGSEQIADCYRKRLSSAFEQIAPTRRTFRNSMNSSMFELFFAASNPAGAKRAIPIADHILRKW